MNTIAPHPGVRDLPTLETMRLVLRPLRDNDADAFQRICDDPEMARNVEGVPYPYPDGAALEWIRGVRDQLDRAEGGALAITLRDTGEVIGDVMLRVNAANHRAELGYILGREHRGRGYATEAAGAMVRCAFEALGLRRLFALSYVRNEASCRVLEKLGFRREARLRENTLCDGVFEDDWLYALLRSEWEAPR